uniref:Transient receptor potential cation channel subfamily M member 4 n=2 Tax=Schistocephalus solidus TaxID=70667 RepID=A0A0X3QCK9_SCHSO
MSGNPVEIITGNEKLSSFIEKHFTYVECTKFVANITSNAKENNALCHCGYDMESHGISLRSTNENTEQWDPSLLCIKKPTIAYGTLRFMRGPLPGPATCHYLRLSAKDEMNAVLELLVKHWNVLPKTRDIVCLSFLGDPREQPSQRLIELLETGLSETARTVDVVVIATGEDCPMTRRIGRALEKVDHLLRKDGNPRVRFVGLMPWSHVSQREFLTVQDGKVDYDTTFYEDHTLQISPFLTHVLLLDDGCCRKFDILNCNEFRWRLESKICMDGGALVVAVLWGGSAGSITQAETRINRHIPLVLLQPTNGAVDVISKAMDFHRAYKDDFEEFSSNEKEILQAMLNNLKSDIPADDAMADLQRLFIDWRLLVFHDIDTNIKLHTTLFDAFSKHRFTAGDYVEFSLKWNRVDKIMLLDPNYLSKIPHARRNNLFASALLADRYPFIPIFVKMGVDLNTIVTPNLLHTLYNESPRVNGLLQLLHASGALRHQPESKQPDFEDKLHLVPLKPRISDTARCCPVIINLHDIHILLRAALGSFDCPEYFSDYKEDMTTEEMEYKLTNPLMHLFMWAVLTRSSEMARALMNLSPKRSTLAEMGATMNRYMVKILRTQDRASKQALEEQAVFYENIPLSS